MAVVVVRTVRCVGYLPTDPPIPAVKVEVAEPVNGRKKEYVAPVDTGFAGFLMVPQADYSELASMELAREAWGSYSTLAGPILMRRARVKMELQGGPVESILETPLHGGGKLLLGRRLLNMLDLALLGGSAQACTLEKVTPVSERPRGSGKRRPPARA